MTLSQVTFESFEEESSEPPRQSADYIRGYEEGIAASEESDRARQAAALEGINATLSDMEFGFTEARVLLLEKIRALMPQITDAILPTLAKESFAEHLRDVLLANFETSLSEPIHIAVHPNAQSMLATALGDMPFTFVFVADPALSDGQAVLQTHETNIMIDLPALVTALQACLNGLEPPERISSNG